MSMPAVGPSIGAYLATITVQNLRCFSEAQTLDLRTPEGHIAQWTLLLGENGTGKTTLLQTIALLVPRHRTSDSAPSRGVSELSRDRARAAFFLKGHHPGACVISVTAGRSDVADASGDATETWSLRPYFMAGTIDDERTSEPAWVPCFAYAPIRAWWLPIHEPWTATDFAGLTKGITLLLDPERWYIERDDAARDPALADVTRMRAARERDTIASLLTYVLPDVTEVARAAANPDGTLPQVVLTTPYGRVPLVELAHGYQSTLAWVVDLAAQMMAAYPESENPLAEPAVVLVDEIDLHLHPKWQRTLLRELSARFPNTQFIATAHSPLVVQAAPEANVVVLRREGDHVVIEKQLRDVQHWRIDQILTSDLFGLPSARGPDLDAPLMRRDALLAKASLTADETRELDTLREKIAAMPGGETQWEMRAMEVIRKAARAIEHGGVRDAPAPTVKKKTGASTRSAKKAPARTAKAPTGAKRGAR